MASAVTSAVVLPVFTPSLQPVITIPALRWGELLTAGLLVAGSAVTIEMGRLFEGRVRVGQRPHKGLSAWAIATVILLPGFWVLPVMVGVYGYARWRGMRVPLWKWVGSGAFLVIAGLIADRVLRIGPPDQPLGLSATPAGTLLVAAAVLAFLAVESALLFGSAHLCSESDEMWLRRTLADPGFYLTEAAVLSLGAVTGLLGAAAPWSVPLLLPAYGLLQQAVLHRPLREQAALDCKTGLLRYEPWLRAATGRLAHHGSTRGPWAVLFADLDHFKDFNDRHGPLAGDRALRRVARVLQDTVRERDLLARFGGEEFCVLLPGVNLDQAVIVAERIRLAIKALTPDDIGGPLTISIGVAGVGADQPEVSLIDALTTADAAMYQAKLAGRDTVRVADHRADPTGRWRPPPVPARVEPHSGVGGFLSAGPPLLDG